MLYVRAGCTHLPSAHCTHRRCRAACAQGPTHCTYWARVPTSGVPHAPCTVAPSGLESPGIERRAVDGGGGRARLGPLGARAHQTQRHVARSGSSGSSIKQRLRRDRPHLRCPVSGPERARSAPPPGRWGVPIGTCTGVVTVCRCVSAIPTQFYRNAPYMDRTNGQDPLPTCTSPAIGINGARPV